MPAKEDKGDAVLAINFIAGSISAVLNYSQDGALWFVGMSGHTCSEKFKRRLVSSVTVLALKNYYC